MNTSTNVRELCETLIEREEATLLKTLTSLHEVRTALMGNNPEALSKALEGQDDVIRAGVEAREQRREFRLRAGSLLKLPAEAVTLERVGQLLPGEDRRRLMDARTRLRALNADVQHVLRFNALFAHSFLDVLQRFFVDITGDQPCERYSRQGTLDQAACGSLIQARG